MKPLQPNVDCFEDDTKITIGDEVTNPTVSQTTVTAQGCQDVCNSVSNCFFFTWASSVALNADDKYKCKLYSYVSNSSSDASSFGYVTGPKNCTLNETRGGDQLTPTRNFPLLCTHLFCPFNLMSFPS